MATEPSKRKLTLEGLLWVQLPHAGVWARCRTTCQNLRGRPAPRKSGVKKAPRLTTVPRKSNLCLEAVKELDHLLDWADAGCLTREGEERGHQKKGSHVLHVSGWVLCHEGERVHAALHWNSTNTVLLEKKMGELRSRT